MSKVTFKFRGFTSLLMLNSFIISLVSGIVLYFPPQGKIAHWTYWTFWGLDKDMWGALHINGSLVFFIIALFHIYYNWKALLRYIKKKAVLAFNLKFEVLISALLAIFIVIATMFSIEPFRTIIRWNENIKNYWAAQSQAQPPIPHAEEMTVTEFCEQFDIPLDLFKQRIKQNGWVYENDDETIKSIAERNNISPAKIYKVLQEPSSSSQGQGSGLGRKSLQQVCDELGKNVDDVVKHMKAQGINVSSGEHLRDIADRNNLRPMDVVDIINNIK